MKKKGWMKKRELNTNVLLVSRAIAATVELYRGHKQPEKLCHMKDWLWVARVFDSRKNKLTNKQKLSKTV